MILNSNRPWKPSPSDRYLTVVCGNLWATRVNGEDHVLGAGQTLALQGKGWLIQALGHGACEFVTAETAPDRPKSRLEERRRPA
jgi:hypothetical protein